MNKISILLPTRNRFNLFKASIDSLYKTCQNNDNFEILVALDNDDSDIEKINEYVNNKNNMKVFIVDRLFYKNLNLYYDILSKQSIGTSLMLWNDDAIMESDNWDYEILNNHNEFCVLSPKVSNMLTYWETQGVLFPIIPKKWFEITNRWSYIQACDSWIDIICKRLGLLKNLSSVIIKHDRHDLTGNNLDSTYAEGRIYVGENKDNSARELDSDCEKINQYIIQLNQNFVSSWGKNPNYAK
jgi:glycosyltransferase involved in cell wall biosynthesis